MGERKWKDGRKSKGRVKRIRSTLTSAHRIVSLEVPDTRLAASTIRAVRIWKYPISGSRFVTRGSSLTAMSLKIKRSKKKEKRKKRRPGARPRRQNTAMVINRELIVCATGRTGVRGVAWGGGAGGLPLPLGWVLVYQRRNRHVVRRGDLERSVELAELI